MQNVTSSLLGEEMRWGKMHDLTLTLSCEEREIKGKRWAQ